MKNKSPAIKNGCVRFGRFGEVELWFTPLNKIFVMFQGRELHPSLRGCSVIFGTVDDHLIPEEVKLKIRAVMKRQLDIRMDWPTREEDEDAWTYHD
jgi:hypothetical protein